MSHLMAWMILVFLMVTLLGVIIGVIKIVENILKKQQGEERRQVNVTDDLAKAFTWLFISGCIWGVAILLLYFISLFPTRTTNWVVQGQQTTSLFSPFVFPIYGFAIFATLIVIYKVANLTTFRYLINALLAIAAVCAPFLVLVYSKGGIGGTILLFFFAFLVPAVCLAASLSLWDYAADWEFLEDFDDV